MMRIRIGLAGLALSLMLVAGCGASPRVHFYTLSGSAASLRETANQTTAHPSVGLGPITLPDVVDRPQLVLRIGVNQVALAEEHRWAEPLRSEIPRVIADNLSQLLDGKPVASYPQQAVESAEIRVLVDVQRFESFPGEAAIIDAFWTVRGRSGKPSSGRVLAREAVSNNSYEALAAAHSRALMTISREIAAAIRITGSTSASPTSPQPPAPPVSPPLP